MWKKRFTGWKRTSKQPGEFVACIEHRGAMRHGVFLRIGARATQEEEELKSQTYGQVTSFQLLVFSFGEEKPNAQARTVCLGQPAWKRGRCKAGNSGFLKRASIR